MGDNLFLKTGKFLKGYVTIQVEGIFLEKFTNLCAVNCLPFWDVKRYGMAKMIGRTTIDGYRRMRHISRKCGCRVRISKKKGIPFFLHRYRKRKLFISGQKRQFEKHFLFSEKRRYTWYHRRDGKRKVHAPSSPYEVLRCGFRYDTYQW